MQEKADKIADSVKGAWDAWKVRHLKFTELESGKISVRAQTPPGTRLAYRDVVAEEGFHFAGTRYNPETIAGTTGKGLLKGAVSKGSLALAGLVAFGTNLLEFGSGKKFGTPEYWDATVRNREFWVSTAVDFAVSVVVGVAAAAVVAAAVSAVPLLFAGAVVSLPVAIVATAVVGIGLGIGVEAISLPGAGKPFPAWVKDSINDLFAQKVRC